MINFIFIFGFVSLYAIALTIAGGFCYWLAEKFNLNLGGK